MKQINLYITEKLRIGKNTSSNVKYYMDLSTGHQIYKYIDKKYEHVPKVYFWFILDEDDFINVCNEFNFYSKDKFNKAFRTLYRINNCDEAIEKIERAVRFDDVKNIVDKYVDNILEIEDPYEFVTKEYKSMLRDLKDVIGNTKVNVDDKDIPKKFADTQYPSNKSIKDKQGNDRVWFKFWKVLAYNGPMTKLDLMRKANPEANEGSNSTMFAKLGEQHIIIYNRKTKMLEAQPVSTWKV